MRKAYTDRVSLDRHGLIQGSRILDRLLIYGSLRPQREPLPNFQLSVRVKILRIADIDRDRHPGPRDVLKRPQLRLAQFGPRRFTRILGRGSMIGQLHDQEFQIILV